MFMCNKIVSNNIYKLKLEDRRTKSYNHVVLTILTKN